MTRHNDFARDVAGWLAFVEPARPMNITPTSGAQPILRARIDALEAAERENRAFAAEHGRSYEVSPSLAHVLAFYRSARLLPSEPAERSAGSPE
jgi:hypothetical protein